MTKIDNRFMSPRMQGIYEHYRRARHFVQLAHRCKNPVSKFTNLITAVYPARAIVELMLEAAEKQELVAFKNKDNKLNRNELEEIISLKSPYYYLLEKIRIHDFHRFGCLPPSLEYETGFIGGPIKLKAKKGIAAMVVTPEGPKQTVTGNSSIKEQRTLYTNNGLYYDEDNKKYVSLEEILVDYLDEVPKVITEFKGYYHEEIV